MNTHDSEHHERVNERQSPLSGRRMKEDYIVVRGKGGCYTCSKLWGTILNTYTNKIVAICKEQLIRNAPHPRDGCHMITPFHSDLSELKLRNRRDKK